MDIGGHRFFSKDERIMDWWQETLPLQGAPSYDDKKLGRDTHDLEPGGPDPEIEDKVMLKRHRVSRIYWNKHFLDYPILAVARYAQGDGPEDYHEGRFLVPEVDGAQTSGRQSGELLHQPVRARALFDVLRMATPRNCGGVTPR